VIELMKNSDGIIKIEDLLPHFNENVKISDFGVKINLKFKI
jgi:hypothetical protein